MRSVQPPRASLPSQTPFHGSVRNPENAPLAPRFFFPPQKRRYTTRKRAVSIWIDDIPPNALRRKRDPSWRGGFSLGVDLGMSRTGLALSKGFTVRPLTVLKSRGDKLEVQLLEIAQKQMVLERYLSMSGERIELVLPKNPELQQKLRRGPAKDIDLFSEDD